MALCEPGSLILESASYQYAILPLVLDYNYILRLLKAIVHFF